MNARGKKTILRRITYFIRSMFHFTRFMGMITVLCLVLLAGKYLPKGISYYIRCIKTIYLILLFVLSSLILLVGASFKIQHWPGAFAMLAIGMILNAFVWIIILVKLASSAKDKVVMHK